MGGVARTIGRKTTLAVILPVLLTALVGMAFSWQRLHQIQRRAADEEASARADLITASFSLADPALPGDASAETAHRHVAAAMSADDPDHRDIGEVRIIGRDGVVRWSRHPEERGSRHPEAERLLTAPLAGAAGSRPGEYVRSLGGERCAACHTTDRLGAVQVRVSGQRVADDLESLFRWSLVFLALMLGVSLTALTLTLRRLVSRPLSRLSGTMNRAEAGDYLVRARVESDDEVGRLAGSFNSMLANLTDLKVAEIEASRELASMQRELTLKAELGRQHAMIEEANRALGQRVREMTLLLDVTRSLNSTLELGEILERVTELVGVTVGVEQFAVMLLDEQRQMLRVASSFGFRKKELIDFELPLGEGASGLAANSREPVYIPDILNDPRYVRGAFDPEGDASLLCVPLICKERLVGVLNFVRQGKSGFPESDIVLLQLVGSQAAMAILNARLFAETRALTLTDALTGLFNRRHLFTRLEMEISRAQRFGHPVSVIMLDIDHFKQLNDTRGHPAGDRILKELAALLRRSVRKVDTVARYGGEEFMLVLPQVPGAEALEVADKLRQAIEENSFEDAEQQPGGRITISLGVASLPVDAQTLETVIDAADAALYESKRNGRNRATLYSPGMELNPSGERAQATVQEISKESCEPVQLRESS